MHAGHAAVHGSVSIRFTHDSHSSTLAGGSHSTSFLHGAHVGGSDSVAAASHVAHKAVIHSGKSGSEVLRNFVTGNSKLQVSSHALTHLQSNGTITISHGNTQISLHGGSTTVDLKGISHSVDFSHKG